VKAATERPVAVDLQAVIALSLQDVIQLANEKRIDVGLSASATAMVMGDQNEIRILFKNLLDNAIRYTPSGGSVDTALDSAHGRVVLEVKDTGPGIPAVLLDRPWATHRAGNCRSLQGNR
jgi:two-component system, OmpR family, sensor kinase